MNESFDAFVQKHRLALVRHATLLSGGQGDAEDLVQEVLIRVYRRWDVLADGGGSTYFYVRRAIANEVVSWRRRWSTRHVWPVDELPELPYLDPPRSRHDGRLWSLLRDLPRQQRCAVALRYYEDLTDEEIAGLLGCREVTVRAHISRGLRALRSSVGSLNCA